jgi:hypothetical protein
MHLGVRALGNVYYMLWYVSWAPTLGNGWLGCIYSPQHKTSSWRKDVLSAAHRTMHCSLSGAPSRCPHTASDRWHYRLFTLDSPDSTPDPVVFSLCHLELAVRVPIPSAPDSLACGTRQSGAPRTDNPQATLLSSLGLHLIFIMSSFEVLLSSLSWSKLL